MADAAAAADAAAKLSFFNSIKPGELALLAARFSVAVLVVCWAGATARHWEADGMCAVVSVRWQWPRPIPFTTRASAASAERMRVQQSLLFEPPTQRTRACRTVWRSQAKPTGLAEQGDRTGVDRGRALHLCSRHLMLRPALPHPHATTRIPCPYLCRVFRDPHRGQDSARGAFTLATFGRVTARRHSRHLPMMARTHPHRSGGALIRPNHTYPWHSCSPAARTALRL